MAAHQLAIAKASFSAALLRPDPTSLSRDDIATFHTLLDNALSHCSRLNVQSCKEWLLQHVAPSSNRVGVLGKYLVALSTSFELSKAAKDLHPPTKPADTRPSGKRKRLHILYLLNDILHHTKYHGPDESVALFANFSSALQPHVVDMVGLTAGYEREKNPKHHRRLNSLLDIWHKHGYYSAEYIEKLQGLVKHAESVDAIKAAVGLTSSADDTQPTGSKRDAPYIMPASHGDSSTPFYDLPAGNIVPHIIPDSTTPIRPETVKPLQFLAGPADQKLVGALTKFFKDVDHIYSSLEQDLPEDAFLDVDELGENIIYDERTGEIIEADTYYGWSREFCQQMKKRRAGETSRRSRSYSSGSEGPYRKRRYSRSDTRGRSRSRSRSRNSNRRRYSASSHSYDSRNPSRPRFGLQSRSRSRSYSPRLDSTPQTHINTLQNPPPVAPNFPTQPYPHNGAGAAHTTQYPANIPTQPQINLNPWQMPHGQYPAGFPPMIPPGMANLPYPYHAAGQPVQYGGQPAPAPGHQMYSGTFPSPWQAGFQNNGQGQQGSYTNDLNQGGKR